MGDTINSLQKASENSKLGYNFEFNSLNILDAFTATSVNVPTATFDKLYVGGVSVGDSAPIFAVGSANCTIPDGNTTSVLIATTNLTSTIGGDDSILIGYHATVEQDAIGIGCNSTGVYTVKERAISIGGGRSTQIGEDSVFVGYGLLGGNTHTKVINIGGGSNASGANNQGLFGYDITQDDIEGTFVYNSHKSAPIVLPSAEDSGGLSAQPLSPYSNAHCFYGPSMMHVWGEETPKTGSKCFTNFCRLLDGADVAGGNSEIIFETGLMASQTRGTNMAIKFRVCKSSACSNTSGSATTHMDYVEFSIIVRGNNDGSDYEIGAGKNLNLSDIAVIAESPTTNDFTPITGSNPNPVSGLWFSFVNDADNNNAVLRLNFFNDAGTDVRVQCVAEIMYQSWDTPPP